MSGPVEQLVRVAYVLDPTIIFIGAISSSHLRWYRGLSVPAAEDGRSSRLSTCHTSRIPDLRQLWRVLDCEALPSSSGCRYKSFYATHVSTLAASGACWVSPIGFASQGLVSGSHFTS